MAHSDCPFSDHGDWFNGGGFTSFLSNSERHDLSRELLGRPDVLELHHRSFEWLATLMAARRSGDDGGTEFDNAEIPAGYTYLAQLVTHDLTMNLRPLGSNAVLGSENGRTPILDLDTLYRGGPTISPLLYARCDDDDRPSNRMKFKIGRTGSGERSPRDLPRIAVSNPDSNSLVQLAENQPIETIIGDSRNEDNLIISQITVLFYRIHNKFVDILLQSNKEPRAVFEGARWLTSNAYRQIIEHDLLPRLVDTNTYNSYRHKSHLNDFPMLKLMPEPYQDGYLPIEFTLAAMRTGHTIIRNNYRFPTGKPEKDNITLSKLLEFRPKQHYIPEQNSYIWINQEIPIIELWAVKDWSRFFPGKNTDFERSKRFSVAVADFLIDSERFSSADSPKTEKVRAGGLVYQDFARGLHNSLPDGFHLSRRLNISTITKKQLEDQIQHRYRPHAPASYPEDEVDRICELLSSKPPLLFFLLAEAELLGNNGANLGPLGSGIMAEVLFAAILTGRHQDGDVPDVVIDTGQASAKRLTSFRKMHELIDWLEAE